AALLGQADQAAASSPGQQAPGGTVECPQFALLQAFRATLVVNEGAGNQFVFLAEYQDRLNGAVFFGRCHLPASRFLGKFFEQSLEINSSLVVGLAGNDTDDAPSFSMVIFRRLRHVSDMFVG